jgi:hypothetical protein
MRFGGLPSLDVLLVAVKKEKISDFTSAISQAGKNAAIVDVDVFALQNCYEVNYGIDPGRVVALLNVGASIMNINIIKGGRNYGWRVFEGAHPYIASPGAAYLPLANPIAEYDHTVGHSITGGFVYRGYSLGAAYRGRYFYADFVNARVFSIALIPAANNCPNNYQVKHDDQRCDRCDNGKLLVPNGIANIAIRRQEACRLSPRDATDGKVYQIGNEHAVDPICHHDHGNAYNGNRAIKILSPKYGRRSSFETA